VLNHTNLILSSQQNAIVLYDFSKVFEGYFEPELMDDRPKVEKFTFDNLFKLSILKYKDPPEPLLRSDANTKFRVNDESLPDEGVLLELPFEASDIIDDTLNGNSQLILLDAYKYEITNHSGLNGVLDASTFTMDTAEQFGPLNYIIHASGYVRKITTRSSAVAGSISGTWPATFGPSNYAILKIKATRRPLKLVYIGDSDGNFDIFTTTNATTTTIANGMKASFGENMLFGSIVGDRYSSLIESMKFPKVVQLWLKIDKGDFLPTGEDSLLYKSFYIKKLNERYFVNRLDQWDPETGIVRAELVRLR